MNDLTFLARHAARQQDPTVPWTAADHARMRELADLEAIAEPPPPPAPEPPPPAPAPVDPFASSPHQRLVLDEQWAMGIDPARWGRYKSPGHAKHGLRVEDAWSVAEGVPGADGRALVCTATWLERDAAIARLAATPMSDADRANVLARITANGGCTVSGGMAHRFDAPTGRYAFRVRSEGDPSAVTSPVCMTWPKENAWWPTRGEFDVYEPGADNTDKKPGHIYLHFGANNSQIPYSVPVDCREWHEVMFDRRKDALLVWYDGTQVAEVRNHPMLSPEMTGGWPHHISLQLDAVKDTRLAAPVRMFVDRVRVWQP